MSEQSIELPTEAGVLPQASDRTLVAVLRDIAALAKPRLSTLVLVTTAGGLGLAPGRIGFAKALLTLAMTTIAVAAANTLNCWLERETDGLMKRTRTRPLPAGRIDPRFAMFVGLAEAGVSISALSLFVNPLTGALAAVAVVSYVALYTPMKYHSPHAVIVGALPGAIPPLLGWAAVTNRIDAGGVALFAILFVWQLPHFLAIALYLREDYARAGIRVLPITHGNGVAKACLAAYAAVLVPVSLSLVKLNLAGPIYGVSAAVLGLALFGWSLTGFRRDAGPRWARGMMLASVVYLTAIFAVLAVDAV